MGLTRGLCAFLVLGRVGCASTDEDLTEFIEEDPSKADVLDGLEEISAYQAIERIEAHLVDREPDRYWSGSTSHYWDGERYNPTGEVCSFLWNRTGEGFSATIRLADRDFSFDVNEESERTEGLVVHDFGSAIGNFRNEYFRVYDDYDWVAFRVGSSQTDEFLEAGETRVPLGVHISSKGTKQTSCLLWPGPSRSALYEQWRSSL